MRRGGDDFSPGVSAGDDLFGIMKVEDRLILPKILGSGKGSFSFFGSLRKNAAPSLSSTLLAMNLPRTLVMVSEIFAVFSPLGSIQRVTGPGERRQTLATASTKA